MTNTFEGNFRFKESDLISDIAKAIKPMFSELTIQDNREMAQQALDKIKTQGNGAIYQGLVEQGIKEATRLYNSNINRSPYEDDGVPVR